MKCRCLRELQGLAATTTRGNNRERSADAGMRADEEKLRAFIAVHFEDHTIEALLLQSFQ
jgi:hypothetical protein